MSILSQDSIVRAGQALNTLTTEERHALTLGWINSMPPTALRLDPKLVNLAMAVIDYYSDMPFAELEALRAQDDPLVLAEREKLERAKHEIESLHNHIVLLNAKNNALRASLDASSARSREVDTDFAVMRADLSTQF